SEMRRVLLYLDKSTGVLVAEEGATVADTSPTPPPTPLVPVAGIPLAIITLSVGQTSLSTVTDIIDARPFLNTLGSSGIGSDTIFDADSSVVVDGVNGVVNVTIDGGAVATFDEDGLDLKGTEIH